MVLESWYIILNDFTKDSGKKILNQVKDINNLLMVLSIKDNIKMENQTDMENIYGKMGKSMKANG